MAARTARGCRRGGREGARERRQLGLGISRLPKEVGKNIMFLLNPNEEFTKVFMIVTLF
jgi:hypothetical protein